MRWLRPKTTSTGIRPSGFTVHAQYYGPLGSPLIIGLGNFTGHLGSLQLYQDLMISWLVSMGLCVMHRHQSVGGTF